MSEQKGYARNIFFSIIISLIVLLTLGYLSVRYLVPIYDIQSNDIYRFLIYLLPVLIGLALIQIGTIISHKDKDQDVDREDLLPKNSYDAPLFETINDDPSEKKATVTLEPITKLEKIPTAREYSIEDFLDKDVASRLKKYDTSQLLAIFNDYEEDKPDIIESPFNKDITNELAKLSVEDIVNALKWIEDGSENKNIIESPFNEEITKELSKLSTDDLIKAIKWLQSGESLTNDSSYIFENISRETVERFQNISQNEADFAIDILDNKNLYNNLASINPNNLCAIARLSDDEISSALQWIAQGSPEAKDPNAVVLDNLDKDTIDRIQEYNSVQVNVGLDYIDLGAPDTVETNYISLANLEDTTKERLKTFDDSYVNRGLDILGNDFVNTFDLNTIQRLNNYDNNQVLKGLDYIDNGNDQIEDLPFGDEINNAIKNFSFEEAQVAVDFIKNPEEYMKDSKQIEALPFGEKINNEIMSLSLDQAINALEYLNNQDEFIRQSEIVEDLPFGNELNNAIRNFTYEEALSAVEFVQNSEDYVKASEQIEDLPFGSELNNAIRSLSREEVEKAINYLNSPDMGHLPYGLDINDDYTEVNETKVNKISQNEILPFDDDLINELKNLSSNEVLQAINYIKNPLSLDDDYGDLSNNLEDFLNSELKDNVNFDFDISLVMFDKNNVLEEERKEDVLKSLPAYTYVYKTENNVTAIVFPYNNISTTKELINNLLTSNSLFLEDNFIDVGYSSKNNRDIDAKVLIDEALN